MRALLATTNAHKASELRALLGFEIDAQGVDVEETGETFAENAMLKARAAAALAADDEIALGEDSGIAVVALGGEPGIRSARFAGPDDAGRRRALLARMDGVEDRRAAYVCALAAVLPDGRELVVEGRLEGSARRGRARLRRLRLRPDLRARGRAVDGRRARAGAQGRDLPPGARGSAARPRARAGHRMTLLAAAAIVTALVGLPAGTTTLPPGAVPPSAHVQVLDRQLGIVAVELPRKGSARALARLRAAPGVREVDIPQAAGGLAAGCTFDTPSEPATSSKASTQWQKTIALSGHNAAGFTVGIPDTGADLGRLGGTRDRLITQNFTVGNGVGDVIDHGTEIASLIGADRPDLGIRGVAPDVGLAIARIATKDNCGPGLIAINLVKAFDWFRQIGDVNIVNVSATLQPNALLRQSLRALQQTGTLVVAATGNDRTPGTDDVPSRRAARARGGGARSRQHDARSGRTRVAGRSSTSSHPRSARAWSSRAGSPRTQQTSVTPGEAKGGTSFAAPLVTGAAALVWARHPAWDASRVAAALMLSATRLKGARPNPNSGYGRLDVKAALHTTPPADLDEPNDWSTAARGLPLLPHGRPLAASVGGSNDPIDAYPIATTGKLTVRVVGGGARAGLRAARGLDRRDRQHEGQRDRVRRDGHLRRSLAGAEGAACRQLVRRRDGEGRDSARALHVPRRLRRGAQEWPSSSSARTLSSTTSGRPRPYHQLISAPSITMLPIR